jgi:L-fuculose-phosphate aldolase
MSHSSHFSQFAHAGRILHECRCNNSHSGNLSIRDGDDILITRTAAMLSQLTENDLVQTSLNPTDAERRLASSELAVHLKIYSSTEISAIAHAHALSAVAAAWLFEDRLRPIDVEGAYYFGSIPILEHNPATTDPRLGAALANILATDPVVILKAHGVFAVGNTLESAAQRVTSVNDSAELILKAHHLGLNREVLAAKDYLQFSNQKFPAPS